MSERPTQIFISYAHADRAHLDSFRTSFGPVERLRNLSVWVDEHLTAGQVWDDRIRRAINGSDIFICLVTANFLNSNYIRDTEMPAIWQAVRGRPALLVPIIVEKCFWDEDFGPVQCLPKDRKGQLKPAADWRPKRDGFHAAAEQAKKAIDAWLNKLPPPPVDPGPGISLQVTSDGFDLAPSVPGIAERVDSIQTRLLEGLRRHWEKLRDDAAKSCVNSHPILCRDLEAYGTLIATSLDELDVVSLVTAGSALGGMVAALRPPMAAGIMTEPLEPELAAGFETLLREHARLILGFAEGREMIARDQLLASIIDEPAQAKQTLHDVLEPMIGQKGLLTAPARTVMQAIDDGLIHAGVRSNDAMLSALRQGARAVGSITRAVSSKISLADAATLAGFTAVMAGDPNFETYKAAFRFLTEYGAQISAFASNQPELRRLVDWAMEQTGDRVSPGMINNHADGEGVADAPPHDFDMDEVRAMILRGEAPPAAWVPWINELDFFGDQGLTDLSPLSGLVALTSLSCADTSVADLSPLSGLVALTSLHCGHTSVADLSPLSSLIALKSLYCWETKVADLSPLSGLVALTSIDCSSTAVTDLSPLSGLTELTDLDCSYTEIRNILVVWALVNLRTLDISGTEVIDLSALSTLRQLTRVYLGDLRGGAVDIAPLNGNDLEELVLLGSEITTQPPPRLALLQIDPDGTTHKANEGGSFAFEHWEHRARERESNAAAT